MTYMPCLFLCRGQKTVSASSLGTSKLQYAVESRKHLVNILVLRCGVQSLHVDVWPLSFCLNDCFVVHYAILIPVMSLFLHPDSENIV